MSSSSEKFCAEAEAAKFRGKYGHLSGGALLEALVSNELKGQLMLSSSFGAESAVLLDLVSQVDPTIPVIFLDTRRLFGETLRYQKSLTDHLALKMFALFVRTTAFFSALIQMTCYLPLSPTNVATYVKFNL